MNDKRPQGNSLLLDEFVKTVDRIRCLWAFREALVRKPEEQEEDYPIFVASAPKLFGWAAERFTASVIIDIVGLAANGKSHLRLDRVVELFEPRDATGAARARALAKEVHRIVSQENLKVVRDRRVAHQDLRSIMMQADETALVSHISAAVQALVELCALVSAERHRLDSRHGLESKCHGEVERLFDLLRGGLKAEKALAAPGRPSTSRSTERHGPHDVSH